MPDHEEIPRLTVAMPRRSKGRSVLFAVAVILTIAAAVFAVWVFETYQGPAVPG